MKIHIITGHFYPQLHPRAFRANELALEFVRRGHQVTVTNCWTIKGFDYEGYTKENGIDEIRNLNFFNTTAEGANGVSTKPSKLKKTINFLKEYLIAGGVLPRAHKMAGLLNISDDTDLVIALSTPFTCLLGLSWYIKRKGKFFVTIADSGDPFYYSKQYSKAPWFKVLERGVYERFDFLTIPTENAIPLYSQLIDEKKIKIIPQGFRMDNLNLYKGSFDGSVRIAYAGVFYRDIRNPEFLFHYLAQSGKEYELYLFMRNRDMLIDEYLEKYPSLKGKIKVSSLPHDELLYELSRMHFLVNIENLSNTQIPSKLIDYGMAGRPIFSCNEKTFSKEKMDRFMNGDYTGKFEVDVQRYNIRRIAEEFLELQNNVSTNKHKG